MRASLVPIPSGVAGVNAKVALMRRMIERGKRSVQVRDFVARALATVPERSEREEVAAIVQAVRSRLRYTRDPWKVETFASPEAIVSGAARIGDCDDFVIGTAAALEHAGYPTKVRAGWRGGVPTHVWLSVGTKKHGWIELDPAQKDASFGWSPELAYEFSTTFGDDTMETIATVPRAGGAVSRMIPLDPYEEEIPPHYRYTPSDLLKGLPSPSGERPHGGRRMFAPPLPLVPKVHAVLKESAKAMRRGKTISDPWLRKKYAELGMSPPEVARKTNDPTRDKVSNGGSVWTNGRLAHRGTSFAPIFWRRRVRGFAAVSKRGPKGPADFADARNDTFDEGMGDIFGSVAGAIGTGASAVGRGVSSLVAAVPRETWGSLLQVGTEALRARLTPNRGRGGREVLQPSALSVPPWLEGVLNRGGRERSSMVLPLAIGAIALFALGGKGRR